MSKAAAIVLILGVTACGAVASRGPASSERLSPSATAGFDQSPQPTVSLNSGEIAGHVSYPGGEVPPAQTVYAVSIESTRFFTVETARGQRTYTMLGVAPGYYFVLSALPDYYGSVASSARTNAVRFQAGYTKAVSCGISAGCSDHTLVPIHVDPGATTSSVDPTDWTEPLGSYPYIPGSGAPPMRTGVPDYSTGPAPPAFQDPQRDAAVIVAAATTSRYVTSAAACPVNVACVWVTARRDGEAAAYLIVTAGSNGNTENCAIYLIDTSSGWYVLDGLIGGAVCSVTGAPFPSVGVSGQIQMPVGQTGCVNIHTGPSLSAKVVTCLPSGTAISIDDGPVYAPVTPPRRSIDLDYWWHIAGKGWIVHGYVAVCHYC